MKRLVPKVLENTYHVYPSGYRGVNINSRHNEESLGELYRKDHIDVSNQDHTAPVYFQSLSLD